MRPSIDLKHPSLVSPLSSRPGRTIYQWLSHPRLPALLALLAILLTLPSVRQGWVADDLIHRDLLLRFSLPDLLKGLFVFVDPGQRHQLMRLNMDLGTLPWWTVSDLRIAFFRPLAVLTHWLDYRLWPDAGWLMHLHNIVWYGAVCGLAALVYRRLMQPAWMAGLAGFLFAVDIVHLGSVAWLANRNGLLAVFFSLVVLLCHHRWRQQQQRRALLWGVVALGLALLAGEAAIGIGAYLFAYAVILDRGLWLGRAASLLPYAVVVVIWRLIYQQMGYGAWGSGFYIDPVREPARFAGAVLERGPVLLAGQWLGQVPILYNLLSASAGRVFWLVALMFVVGIGLVLAPLLRADRTARFWALGMGLAVIPACAISLLSGRLLLFVGLGAMALMAQFLGDLFQRSTWVRAGRGWRILAWGLGGLLIVLHVVLPPLLMPVLVNTPGLFQSVISEVTDLPLPPDVQNQDIVLVNAPSPFHFIYFPSLRVLSGEPMPAHLRQLAPGYTAVDITRVDEQTLVVRPEQGYLVPDGIAAGDNAVPVWHNAYIFQHLDKFFRGDAFPVAVGQQIQVAGMQVTVTEITSDGRPAEAEIVFPQSLEDPQFLWLQWDWKQQAYTSFNLPGIGQTVHIPGPFIHE